MATPNFLDVETHAFSMLVAAGLQAVLNWLTISVLFRPSPRIHCVIIGDFAAGRSTWLGGSSCPFIPRAALCYGIERIRGAGQLCYRLWCM